MKTITYPIILATRFPAGHCYENQPTLFELKLHLTLECPFRFGQEEPDCLFRSLHKECKKFCLKKAHTLRGNYKLWEKRFEKINRGEAVLSVRVWEGRPYNSPQREIVRLSHKDGIGLQKLTFNTHSSNYVFVGDKPVTYTQLAQNDGLSFLAWCSWFSSWVATEPLAVIHFTPFRY